MARPLTIIGSFVSPYVRKVLACMNLKGLSFEVDPITPFFGNDEFERLSPLRRIPVLIDGDVSVSDSTVICEYLDDVHPKPPLRPADPYQRALMRNFVRWTDEHALPHLLILNWNENIIPAVAKLSQEQAAAYFMLGET